MITYLMFNIKRYRVLHKFLKSSLIMCVDMENLSNLRVPSVNDVCLISERN